MINRFVHSFVLLMALVMPFQAFAMVTNCALTGDVAHCKQMQQTPSMQDASTNASMPEHCQLHANKSNSHQKQASLSADCCLGNACTAICLGLVFPVSLSLPAFGTANDFTLFITPRFSSQSVEGLERPPRTFS